MKIGIVYQFDAKHSDLPHNLVSKPYVHEHSYRLEVEVSGEVRELVGQRNDMTVLDRGVLDEIVAPIVHDLEDTDLDITGPRVLNWGKVEIRQPTMEALVGGIVFAILLSDEICAPNTITGKPFLSRVRLWESEVSYAEWFA